MQSLGIVIVNYNTRELLAQCLRSVYAGDLPVPFHVIVIDNLSTDGSAEMVEAGFPQSTLIVSDRNGGFGYANNLALRWLAGQERLPSRSAGVVRASGPRAGRQPAVEIPASGSSSFSFPCDYVLFLNPDTVLPTDAVRVTVDFLEAHQEAAVVGPKMVKPDGTLDLACRRSFPTPVSSFFKLTGLSRLFPRSPLVARYKLTYMN